MSNFVNPLFFLQNTKFLSSRIPSNNKKCENAKIHRTIPKKTQNVFPKPKSMLKKIWKNPIWEGYSFLHWGFQPVSIMSTSLKISHVCPRLSMKNHARSRIKQTAKKGLSRPALVHNDKSSMRRQLWFYSFDFIHRISHESFFHVKLLMEVRILTAGFWFYFRIWCKITAVVQFHDQVWSSSNLFCSARLASKWMCDVIWEELQSTDTNLRCSLIVERLDRSGKAAA